MRRPASAENRGLADGCRIAGVQVQSASAGFTFLFCGFVGPRVWSPRNQMNMYIIIYMFNYVYVLNISEILHLYHVAEVPQVHPP